MSLLSQSTLLDVGVYMESTISLVSLSPSPPPLTCPLSPFASYYMLSSITFKLLLLTTLLFAPTIAYSPQQRPLIESISKAKLHSG